MFDLDNVKNEVILRDFVISQCWQHQKRSNSARLPSKKKTAPTTKTWCQVIRSAAPVTQTDEAVSCTAPATENASLQMCFAPQRRALFRHLSFQKRSGAGVFCTLYILTWTCASRHNGVHFCDIATSKSGRTWFVLCILTSKCALRHNDVTFSTSQLPKVVRTWCVLRILTSKCASCQNGVQFFILHLASWLRTRRFSEPPFRPSGATNQWKNTVFRDFPTFSRTWIFFLLTLSLLWSSLFYSSLLSGSSRLCFSFVHIVGSLTSKLPSTIH